MYFRYSKEQIEAILAQTFKSSYSPTLVYDCLFTDLIKDSPLFLLKKSIKTGEQYLEDSKNKVLNTSFKSFIQFSKKSISEKGLLKYLKEVNSDDFADNWLESELDNFKVDLDPIITEESKDTIVATRYRVLDYLSNFQKEAVNQKENCFIFSNPLSEIIREPSLLDIELSSIIKTRSFFMQFPIPMILNDEEAISIGSIINLRPESEKFNIEIIDFIFLLESKTIKIIETNISFTSDQFNSKIKDLLSNDLEKTVDALDFHLFCLVINGAAYLIHHNRDRKNISCIPDDFVIGQSFTPKNSDYVLVGSDYKEVRDTTENPWLVRGHFRYQSFGSGANKHFKLIRIRPYQKQFLPAYIDDEKATVSGGTHKLHELKDRASFILKLESLLKSLKCQYKIHEEFRVSKDSLHRIDYCLILPEINTCLGLEYKSSKAKWNRDKIEQQRMFYDFYLRKKFPDLQLKTLLVSDNGKYGFSEKQILNYIEKLLLSEISCSVIDVV